MRISNIYGLAHYVLSLSCIFDAYCCVTWVYVGCFCVACITVLSCSVAFSWDVLFCLSLCSTVSYLYITCCFVAGVMGKLAGTEFCLVLPYVTLCHVARLFCTFSRIYLVTNSSFPSLMTFWRTSGTIVCVGYNGELSIDKVIDDSPSSMVVFLCEI